MKTYLFLIIFVCFISCNLPDKSSVEYCNKFILHLNAKPEPDAIQGYFDNFYLTNGYYPNSIQEFFEFLELEKYDDVDFFRGCTFRDPYLSDESIWEYYMNEYDETLYEGCFCQKPVADSLLLHYCPIYGRNSDLPVSFVLLSVGEDKVLNSNTTEKLYTDNWEKHIKAYNRKQAIDDEKKLTYVAYPVFSERSQYFVYAVIAFDKSTFESKQVVLRGDTIFNNILRYSMFDEDDRIIPFPSVFTEYSRYRAMFGRKDYIVARGREFIKYEIVTE
jgi:hypothetical protein